MKWFSRPGEAIGPGGKPAFDWPLYHRIAPAVMNAAKAEGVDTKVKLTGPEMRKTIEDLSMVASYTTVAAIGGIIKDCFDGTITEGTMVKKLAVLVGDKAPATKKVS